jgi:hypothetical protein
LLESISGVTAVAPNVPAAADGPAAVKVATSAGTGVAGPVDGVAVSDTAGVLEPVDVPEPVTVPGSAAKTAVRQLGTQAINTANRLSGIFSFTFWR